MYGLVLKENIPKVVTSAVFACVGTAGQRCTTLRRLIVHEDLYDEVSSSPIWQVSKCSHNSIIQRLLIPKWINTSSKGVGETKEVLCLDYGQTGRSSWRWHTLRAPSQQGDWQQKHYFTYFFGCFCVLTLNFKRLVLTVTFKQSRT